MAFYSYSGFILPELPSGASAGYALLSKIDGSKLDASAAGIEVFAITCSTEQAFDLADGYKEVHFQNNLGGSFSVYICSYDPKVAGLGFPVGTWIPWYTGNMDGEHMGIIWRSTNPIVWTNKDIPYGDDVDESLGEELVFRGVSYSAGSYTYYGESYDGNGGELEPTPSPIDPISMTMGWLVGRRIAGQRGKPDVPEVIATLENGVLYIQSAPAELNGNILEVI